MAEDYIYQQQLNLFHQKENSNPQSQHIFQNSFYFQERDMSVAITSPLKMISSTSSTPDNSTVESPGINHDPNFMLQLQRSTSQSQLTGHPSILSQHQMNHNNISQNAMNSSNSMASPNSESYDSEDDDDSDIAGDEDEENMKRREAMYRRPSFKRILDDLEGNSSINPEIKKEPIRDQNDCMDNNNEIQVQPMLPPNALPQDLSMANQLNLLSTSKYVFQNPAPVQLLTTSTGHDVPSINSMISLPNQNSTVRTPYQSIHPGMLSPALFMTPQAITTQQQMADEAAKKREIRLMKNRIAAKECRRKKKEYVKCLESRVQVLENQNKALIDELRSLKDLYLPKNQENNIPSSRTSNSDLGMKDLNDQHQ